MVLHPRVHNGSRGGEGSLVPVCTNSKRYCILEYIMIAEEEDVVLYQSVLSVVELKYLQCLSAALLLLLI